MLLHQVLAVHVARWRADGYPAGGYPVLAEILDWAANPSTPGFRLRPPQVRALETYWYLRLVENTPRTIDLYRRMFDDPRDLLAALGVPARLAEEDGALDGAALDRFLARTLSDDSFARTHKLDTLRETLALAYPSYILALAMGAGKTALIGAIIATEFALALEYPNGPFVQNALVFAPGKTILESLRELAGLPYQAILPPRLYKPFAASLKLIFTRDGETTLPLVPASYFNVVVTNTEKIRIRASAPSLALPRRTGDGMEEGAEIANQRLTALASLPGLAVFSDEAHHTYGRSLGDELKKVRKTVDYLAARTDLVCVINTTGTPYFRRQMLHDVVVWYGLSEGIRDGILKEVSGNIQAIDFDRDVDAYLAHVVADFFAQYQDVFLLDGTPAKLAIFFPNTSDATRHRPTIERSMAALGLSPALILEHHTRQENKADFDRFRSNDSPHRVALLVDRGVEGWDVPALFACALARKLKTSNNFVLQAASRCLRQAYERPAPGNHAPGRAHKASIYLSMDNLAVLDRQLRDTYGEGVAELNQAQPRPARANVSSPAQQEVSFLPPALPPVAAQRPVTASSTSEPLHLVKPVMREEARRYTYALEDSAEQGRRATGVLALAGVEALGDEDDAALDVYTVATDLSAIYRLGLWDVYDALRSAYGKELVPESHLRDLRRQIEEQRP